jgi:pyroglutamyl-peptidase
MKALVTGFDAFGGDKVNPSSAAIARLKRKLGRLALHTAILPTSYARSAIALRGAIHEVRPDIVLCVGQAGGRSELSLERVAINVQDARIKDNDGKQPIDREVVRDGSAAHFTTLPIKACVAELRRAGLPAGVSNSAGTFVCNHIFYSLMDMAGRHRSAARPRWRSTTSCAASRSWSRPAPRAPRTFIRPREESLSLPRPRASGAASCS